jgi:hypothetical protein
MVGLRRAGLEITMPQPQPSPPDFRAALAQPFADDRQAERFLALAHAYFLDRRRHATYCAETFAMREGQVAHGLTNLAQVCAQAPEGQWERLIRQHLDRNDTQQLTSVLEQAFALTFEELRPQLSVRLQSEDFLDVVLRDHLVCRRDLPGTVTVLMLDLGPSTCALPAPVQSAWGNDLDTCFTAALTNLVANEPRSRTLCPSPRGLVQLRGHSASALALAFAAWPDRGSRGTLCAAPTRDSLLLLPLDQPPDAATLRGMARIAHAQFRAGPHSITPHLYLRTPDGAVELEQVAVDGSSVQLAAGPRFGALCAGN